MNLLYSLLTVDDESYIHQGLDKLMNWEGLGFAHTASVLNGEEALRLAARERPEVIVTDIRMPDMGGLELIRKIDEIEDYDPAFVILSGYGEFDYAQTAMQHRVRHYILKPVDENELASALQQLRHDLDERRRVVTSQATQRAEAVTATIGRLIRGESGHRVLQSAADLLGISPHISLRYVMILVDVVSPDEEIADRLEDIVGASCAEVMGGVRRIHVENQTTFGLVITASELAAADLDIHGMADGLQKRFSLEKGIRVKVAAGREVAGLSRLQEAYRSVQVALARSFFEPEKRIVLYDDLRSAEFDTALKTIVFFPDLIRAVEDQDSALIESQLDTIFERFRRKLMAPEVIKTWLASLALDVSRIVVELGGVVEPFVREFLDFSLVPGRLVLDDLKRQVMLFSNQASTMIGELRDLNRSDVVALIKARVDRSSSEALTLKDMGAVFSMHPVYLGQLFKKTLGRSFKDYLREVRVAEACKLLRRTNLRVYEVASSVGYHSVDYFSAQFERETGTTPAAFRVSGIPEV